VESRFSARHVVSVNHRQDMTLKLSSLSPYNFQNVKYYNLNRPCIPKTTYTPTNSHFCRCNIYKQSHVTFSGWPGVVMLQYHFFYFDMISTMDCNPGVLFQSRDFGIEKCQSRDPGLESRDWVPDFKVVEISSNNSLVLVSWWVLEFWYICWSQRCARKKQVTG